MSDYLYRFRSMPALLDGFHELENQEIYFSPPEQLNDPLEGFKDVFWQGDRILWTNLLRHYLLCLMQATSITAITGKEFSPELCHSLVHQTSHDLPAAPIRETYALICKEFFGHDAPKALVAWFSSGPKAVRRDELIFYLRVLHCIATSAVFKALDRRGLGLFNPSDGLEKTLKSTDELMEDLLRTHSHAADAADEMCKASEIVLAQLALIHEYNGDFPEDRRQWFFVACDFPDFYVNALERLIYPDWHTACFVANPTNASMWGAYGDGHKGICLKFRVAPDGTGHRSLELYRANSWSGGGKDGNFVANYAYVPHRFEEIRYTADFPEIDFFQSLGTVPMFKLKFWYDDENGERSPVASKVMGGDKSWHKDHWERFSASYCTKTTEWAHEQEYRLILYSLLQRFDDVPSRKLKYKFSDLTGIIFGIKTKTEDKIRIMRMRLIPLVQVGLQVAITSLDNAAGCS